jgi:CheY-like chemotaxis protein
MEQKARVPQIVLIEDNPADALLVRMALKENGIPHVLTECRSGFEAVKQLCTSGRENMIIPDVILLDLHTPQCDGFEVLCKLRQYFSQVPIAVVTSSRARADRLRTEREGAMYIEKPSDLEAFISCIGRAVNEMLNKHPLFAITPIDKNKSASCPEPIVE